MVVRLEGNTDAAHDLLARLPDVERIERAGDELWLAVRNGPAAIPLVATTLADVPSIAVREMALRRPTLDDAFFALTGHGLSADAAVTAAPEAA